MAVPVQYGQQDAYAQPGAMYPAGYVDPAYAAQQTQPMYGTQPYAGDPYGQTIMGVPSNPAMSPLGYDPGYANYMYGMQGPPSPRRYVIQAAQAPRRGGLLNTDSILTVLIVCGTLFLVLLAMLLIVTVVVPRLTRKHHSSHKRRHEFPMEHDNVADVDLSNMDAPQVTVVDKAVDSSAKRRTAVRHSPKDAALISKIKRRIKG
ncbi:uncharacterized protein LOC144119346 [Amblyomma americanum]